MAGLANEIIRRSGLMESVIWTWQERFMHEGVEGLLRGKTRKPGKPHLPTEVVQRVIDLTFCEPSGEVTHLTRGGAGRSHRHQLALGPAHLGST